MSTFDGWETQFYGDCLSYGQDSLMHFRTKGSKNGVRRYQNPDGTWTDLGLKERRAREGFGERIKKKIHKAARQHRIAKAAARSARAERIEKFKERLRKNNPKNLSDAELKAGIERLKMEKEYRELNKNPLVETGQKLVEGYLKAKNDKLDRQERRNNQIIALKKAQTEFKKAKADNKRAVADKRQATADIVDTILRGAKKRKADKEWGEYRTKSTIRGAMVQNAHDVLRKQGTRFVNDMGDHSVVVRGGRAVKRAGRGVAKLGRKGVDKVIHRIRTGSWR